MSRLKTPLPRTLIVLLILGLVVILLAVVLGFFTRLTDILARRHVGSAREEVRTRYDCLIIRDLSGKNDVVTSSGFPAYVSAQEARRDGGGVAPAASRIASLLGTQVRIAVYGMDANRAEAAVTAGLERIAQLSKQLNIFDPKSAVSGVNREAHVRTVKTGGDFDRLIRQAILVSKLSGGAFDVTVGPLTALWRKYRREKRLPSAGEVERARDLVGYRGIELTEAPGIRFARKGMSLDFGGVAKGFATEEAAKALAKHGVRSAIIDCGGDLKLIGSRPGGKPFRIGVDEPKPGAVSPFRFVLSLSSTSVVTSGNYRQFTMLGGKRLSHIIDPRTGWAIEALPSVTVVGPDSGMCDALATAISVLGEEEGLKLIEKVNAKP